MLRIEEDLPEEQRLTLAGEAWTGAEVVRSVMASALVIGVAAGVVAIGTLAVQALVLAVPFGFLVMVGIAGVQPERVTRIEVVPGELRVRLHGAWIWRTRTLRVLPGQLTRVSLFAHDVSLLGPDRPELGIQLLASGQHLTSIAIAGVERHDEVLAIAHRIALALGLGVQTKALRYELQCVLTADGPPPPPPQRIRPSGYRRAPELAPLDVSRGAEYVAPAHLIPDIAEVERNAVQGDEGQAEELVTSVLRKGDRLLIRGERAYVLLIAIALETVAVVGGFTYLFAGPMHGNTPSDTALGYAALACIALFVLTVLWIASAPVGLLLALLAKVIPSSPRRALFAGGALPDAGGVSVRRGFRVIPCTDKASVFLVHRAPSRRTRSGGLPRGACWAEVWIRDRGRWSLFAKGQRGEPAIRPSLEALAHEAARRLDTPVRFVRRRG